MKVLVTTVAIVGLCALVGRSDADVQPAGALTIEEAIRLALTRNERAAIAELDLVVADAGVSRARVAFLPVLAANASDTLKPLDTPINVAQGQISINQSLIDPTAFPRLAGAKHALASQRAQTIDDKRKLAFDATKAFVAVLLADQVAQAAQRKLATAKANLADTDAQVKAQLVSSNDVTRAQISLASAVRELAADQGRLRSAYIELALVINAPVPAGLAPPTALLASGQEVQPAEDALVAESLGRRLDLVAHKQAALAAHDSAREPRLHYWPSLGLGAQVSATSNAPGSGRNVDTQVALTASWIIFDGGARAADIRSRDAQAEIADLQTSSLARSIAADVRTAAIELAAAQQALVAARDAREAARKGADEAAILYRQGLAKAIELLDANDQRFAAEVGYATAEFDVASAYLGLRLALGLSPLEIK